MLIKPRTWAKLTIGVLTIGGIVAVLWALYDPEPLKPVAPEPTPAPARLHAARATVVVSGAAAGRASIRCDGERRSASGFWAGDAVRACDALAATRGALLSGPGCRRRDPGRVQVRIVGSVEGRRFDHAQQRGGCPDPDGWLAVDVLASPVLAPDSEADEGGSS
jgi:hypothetical protein